MARRVAELDYRVTGAGRATGEVRTLAQALEIQRRNAHAAQPALNAAQRGAGMLGSVSQASAMQVMALSGALGPLGAGLGAVAVSAPNAARGLMAYAAAHERAGILSRATNAALLGGSAVMATGAAAAVAYAGSILRGADAYAALNSRLRIFSEGAVAAAQNEQSLYQRAAEARTGVENLSTLFVRITPAIDDMGRAQADALQVTENASKALAIQGATMAEAAASTVQFSQAIASGVLRGDELRSMLESSPLLLRYIAQHIEMNGQIGVAFGQLRKLGEEGALTADKLIDALLRASPQIEADFINAPKTAQQGWTILKDTITRTTGQLAQSVGLQDGVYGFLSDLANRLDAFRTETLLNPDALDPAVRAAELLGGALDTAGKLAGGVAEHFDLITAAAQALIALKAGEMLAVGFGAAVAKAREAQAAIQSFRANGYFVAGQAMDEMGAKAAIQARAVADAARARSADLVAQSEIRARNAVSARAAAEAAAIEVTRLKAASSVQAAVVAEAEAHASALNTAAERAETAAKSATTAATNAQTAASTRLAIAQEAEAAVTRQVTGAQALKTAGGRALAGVYSLLGGGIGVLTLALGGLVYAVWRSEQAWREKIAGLREAVDVSDELRSISDALATATWAEIPALMASANAMREKAEAARDLARSQREEAESRLAALNTPAANVLALLGGPMQMGWQNFNRVQANRAINDYRGAESLAETARWKNQQESEIGNLRYQLRDAQRAESENRAGVDSYGQPLTAERRAANEATRARILADAQRRRDDLVGRVAGAREMATRNPNSTAHGDVAEILSRQLDVLNEITGTRTPQSIRPPTSSSGGGSGGGRSAQSSEDRAIAALLERVQDAAALDALMGRTPSAGGRFTVADGVLSDGGKTFVARSEDEARAAAAYLEQIEAITQAKASLIAETGLSREALAAQAAQTLATALATSSATQADQRWQERMADARGESTATAQAEREVAEARRQGATVTDQMADAYIRLLTAQERARRAQEALNAVRPVVDEVGRAELDQMGRTPERWRTDVGGMGFDLEGALAEWAAARERIAAEVERRIRAEQDKAVTDGLKTREQADEETSRRIAAARVALETQNAEQVADIWRRQRDDDARAWEERLQQRLDQERQLADSVTGALEDLAMGGDPSDVGRRFAEDLLRGVWQELVTNPLNLMIRNLLREMTGGKNGGLWGTIGSLLGGLGGGAATAKAVTLSAKVSGLTGHADGGLPGVRRLSPGLILGAGGARDDRILARVSSREFISNAAATANHLPLLQRLNAGMSLRQALDTPAFVHGGLPGGLGDMIARDIRNGDLTPSYGTPMDYDRDRVRAETSASSAAQVEVPVTLINETGTPMKATASRGIDGSLVVALEQLTDARIKTAGPSGLLASSLQSSPPKKRR